MAIFRDIWSPTGTYAIGDLVNFEGVVYENLTGMNTANNPSQDITNWEVSYVERIEGLTSIVEQARIEINVDDDVINNSMLSYVQRSSNYMNQRIRPSTNSVSTITQVVGVSNDGYEERRYIRIPGDLLEIENIRLNTSNPGFYGLLGQGVVEFKAATSDADFERVLQYYRDENNIFGYRTIANFRTPVYRFITIGGASYFELAPAINLDIGEDIEIRYRKSEPQLGTIHPRVNNLGEPVNAQGQNLAQFLADTTVMHTPATITFTLPTETSTATGFISFNISLDRPGTSEDREEVLQVNVPTGVDGSTIAATIVTALNNQWSPAITFARTGAGGRTLVGTSAGVGVGTTIAATVRTTYSIASGVAPDPEVTAVAGGPPFVQDMVRITENWFTANAPYAVLYGTLFMALQWLKDSERAAQYKALYDDEEARIIDMIYRFENNRPTDLQMYSPYSI